MKEHTLIYFAGLDGSGKTTIAKRYAQNHKIPYIWARWSPQIVKPFVNFVKYCQHIPFQHFIKNSGNQIKIKDKRKIFSLPLLSKIWLIVAEFDYLMQLSIKIYIPYLSHNKIICDRYIYDFYVDQLINLGEKPSKLSEYLKRWMPKLFPNPKIIIYIKVKPETGYKRKNDGTSISYLRIREKYYEKLKELFSAVQINGENSQNQVYKKVTQRLSQNAK